tara:strand:- start:925 stop:1452 length:528 start_codon:yes stop_codon:yes gene_type:complete
MAQMKVIGVAGYSGSGKTTLISGLVKILTCYNIKTGTIKHTHHSLDILPKNHISDALMNSGANEVMVTNNNNFVINRSVEGHERKTISDYIYINSASDLFLVEGFKHQPFPKIEVWNGDSQPALLAAADPYIVAIAVKNKDHQKLPRNLCITTLDLDDHHAIAKFICYYFGLTIQ